MKHPFTNQLITETSPYLLQHAHNPVSWHAWNDETLALAKKENKLMLISIGYAACHWCHVMEHESFEDKEVAAVMNRDFINIKVDREERPDVDQVYMDAVQLLTKSGGWPLHCVALPNGKPIWGGTYFKKEDWMQVLEQLSSLYKSDPKKVENYADELTAGIVQTNLIHPEKEDHTFSLDYLRRTVEKWQIYFDDEYGGTNRAPKFPMPNNIHFLLRLAYQTENTELLHYVNTTLTKMALGGIFDQIGGGFSRYAVDKKWHIPHFEKMLYDNGQLVSVYADAYLITKNPLYKETVYETLSFVEKELLASNGGFYASLDADSLNEKNELEEGAYYVWTKQELMGILKADFSLFSEYYNINSFGHWELDKYHLIRTQSDADFAAANGLSHDVLKQKIAQWKAQLQKVRQKRNQPRLDDKILCSWNALMLKGYIDAYRVFNERHFLSIALKNATFIERHLIQENGNLYRNYKNGKASINGFLEDYGTLIDAFITVYEVTLEEKWLQLSKNLTDTALAHFLNKENNLFYFTSDQDVELIVRKTEIEDHVIPSSNSIMAHNLFKLGHFFDQQYYLKLSKGMLQNMTKTMENYGSGYSNWLSLYAQYTASFFEVAVVGPDALEKIQELNQNFIPNKLICGSTSISELPLLADKFVSKKTYIYVCKNSACLLPTESVNEAISLIKNA